jgi:acyl-CoA reductase-like NAD-dependent aldehyde dehydrogenase
MATTTEEWIEVHSPYNGEVVGRAAKSGAADARQAIDAASRALESPLPAHERAAILDRTAGLLRERHEDMARTICAEAGRSRRRGSRPHGQPRRTPSPP